MNKIGKICANWANKWIPDPFILAISLTAITAVLAFLWGPNLQDGNISDRLKRLGDAWMQPASFWNLLKFGMEMTLILVTGFAVASCPLIRRIVRFFSSIPKSSGSAVALVAFISILVSLIHWGLGVIVGALLARDVAIHARDQNIKVHYPLLGAAGYVGLMVWHGGWSGTAPLKLASSEQTLIQLQAAIPLSDTIFSPMNLFASVALLVLVPLAFYFLAPKKVEDIEEAPDSLTDKAAAITEPQTELKTFAGRLENSRWLAFFVGAIGLTVTISYAVSSDFAYQIGFINGVFLFLGILLHSSIRSFLHAIGQGVSSASGIILQFPFYAGIMGMMKVSGLDVEISRLLSEGLSAASFAPASLMSSGLVNLFVPSGGGQVAVQGGILLNTAKDLAVPLPKAVMALAYGDQLTNMLQPFWALPLLGITGLKAGQILGYSMIIMCVGALIFLCALSLF